MKKFFIVLICLTIAMPILAEHPILRVERPTKEHIEKWQKEYKDNLAKCPTDKPLYTKNGECRSCNDPLSFEIPGFTDEFCSQICPNRKSIRKVPAGVIGYWDTYCVLKNASNEESKTKNCPDDKPLYVDGECMPCNEYKNWDNVKNVLGYEKCTKGKNTPPFKKSSSNTTRKQ